MCTSNFEKDMDIAVKPAVQALDPACGLWLSAKVVDRKEEQFQVRWVFYNTTDWLHQSKIYAGKRRLKYEWLMETPEDGEAEQETRLPFRSLPLLATRITVADAPPSDDGRDDLSPYADGLEDQATIAIETVVANAQAEGNSIQLPAEWKNATPPFSCSAVCDSKIAQLQERVQYLENAVAMLRAAMEDKENQQPVEPAYFAAAPLPPSPPAASLSRVIGDAMGVVADEPIPTTPQAHEQITDPREMPAPSTNSLSLILMECGHDRTQLARRLLENFFSTQERLSCNTSGTRGKRQLDTDKLAEVRRLIFSYAPVSSPQAESTEWKRLKTVMDLANRHLRQSLKERCT
ncbi:hypothetical protein HOLleu_21357 [Holothuria leucospilota]|uniref:BEN domain-containing protein n=1 Tax=Holothuria leucospilota TaxID=206669 RepID=A0A9Q1BXP0_HOLLE|nr:hypothetical protein HOLleu_21357 [Holothuria leucospilota]